ncbi:MAG: hypothetical protein ISS49_17050 [Anaerolineae bacterium]|nr:hypothetical protein [Anaerolineae bacterium]
MNRDEQFRRNHDLFEIFMQQVLDDPELLDDIPNGVNIVFLPDNDPELLEANRELGRIKRQEGKQVVFVQVKLVPEVRTVFVPRLSVKPAFA